MRYLFLVAILAYVDPGILGALYQIGYIAFFALISFFIFRPWAFLKSTASKLFNKGETKSKE